MRQELVDLRKAVEGIRDAGGTPAQSLLDRLAALEAENTQWQNNEQAAREKRQAAKDAAKAEHERKAQAIQQQLEAQFKAEVLKEFLSSGGTQAEFDIAYPKIREQAIIEKTQAKLAKKQVRQAFKVQM